MSTWDLIVPILHQLFESDSFFTSSCSRAFEQLPTKETQRVRRTGKLHYYCLLAILLHPLLWAAIICLRFEMQASERAKDASKRKKRLLEEELADPVQRQAIERRITHAVGDAEGEPFMKKLREDVTNYDVNEAAMRKIQR
jgi:hypothetical protein